MTWEASLGVACSSCGGSDVASVYEVLVRGRLQWVFTQDCPDGLVEEMGWDETPEEYRQALLDQCGVYRLRVPGIASGKKVLLMKVLRDRGMTLTKLPEMLATLSSAGLAGTRVELSVLAGRMTEVEIESRIDEPAETA